MSSKPIILCLSYYFSTDRILLYTAFLKKLAEYSEPSVWSLSVMEKNFPAKHSNGRYFEYMKGKDSIPRWVNWARHFSGYVWDHKGLSFSKESMWRLRKLNTVSNLEKVLWKTAEFTQKLRKGANFDHSVEKLMVRYGYCVDSKKYFEVKRPEAIVAMVPFTPLHMSIIAAARKTGITTIAYITSWDNITTKTRLSFNYDGYLVWSEAMKRELIEFHPQSKNKPIHVIGAPQYDILLNPAFHLDKKEFFERQGLDIKKKLVVYCLGSPNFIREDFSVKDFLKLVDRDLRDKIQVVVRLHPGFYEDDYKILPQISQIFPDMVIQGSRKYFDKHPLQPEESIVEWVNTFRHADVVINLASTVTVDGSIFDKPVININYDCEPGEPNKQLIREINRNWNHFEPIANSGGVWNVDTPEQLISALKTYLANPSLHSAGRRKIVEHVCGELDGKAGEKMATAIEEIVLRMKEYQYRNDTSRSLDSDTNETKCLDRATNPS